MGIRLVPSAVLDPAEVHKFICRQRKRIVGSPTRLAQSCSSPAQPGEEAPQAWFELRGEVTTNGKAGVATPPVRGNPCDDRDWRRPSADGAKALIFRHPPSNYAVARRFGAAPAPLRAWTS